MKIIFLVIMLLFSAFDTSLKTTYYTVCTDKTEHEIRIALITDLHSCSYGENQQQLIDAVNLEEPDAVFLAGDIFDDWMPDENSQIFTSRIAENYPTYYVSGNHEWWSGRMEEMFDFLTRSNVCVLRGECDRATINGQAINILGIDDPDAVNYDPSYPGIVAQLENALNGAGDCFTILLSHRPELASVYFSYPVDLALSGHAHGGQWRIPYILNGLYAPNQGFFPSLAGGKYHFGDKTLIVSRGLSRENQRIPRIFNPPEVVFITISPN